MELNKRLKVGFGVLIVGILFWQYGFFNRFNYLTAKIDIWRGSPRIVTVGIPEHPCGVPCIGLKELYGFHESNAGCVVTNPQLRGINAYNSQVEKHLVKRNGEGWRHKYESELDSLIYNNLLE